MAINGENSEVKDSPSVPLSCLQVTCKSSSKIRRFSIGTEAGFAVNLINRKLDDGLPLALYIESVKEGEEPVNFGPNSVLTCYGNGWKLQTVTETEGRTRARESIRGTTKHESSPLGLDELQSTKGLLPSVMGVGYIAKVVFAFVLLFVFGAVFTLALENLPRFLIFVNSSIPMSASRIGQITGVTGIVDDFSLKFTRSSIVHFPVMVPNFLYGFIGGVVQFVEWDHCPISETKLESPLT